MRRNTTAILGALIIGSSFLAPTALAQPVCGAHRTVVENLKKGYSETPVSMGVTSGGAILEVYASPEGTWTLVITQPSGLSCLLAAGQDWENLPKLASGAKI